MAGGETVEETEKAPAEEETGAWETAGAADVDWVAGKGEACATGSAFDACPTIVISARVTTPLPPWGLGGAFDEFPALVGGELVGALGAA